MSLAEALYGPKARNKGINPPVAEPEIGTQSEPEIRQESEPEAAAHGEEDLRQELGEALEKLSRIQADYYAGLASVGDFNDAKCRVGDLRNQLDVNPAVPTLSTAIGRPRWIPQPKFEE